MTIEIQPIQAFCDNYIWAIIDHQRATAIVVDPGDAQPVIDYLHAHSLSVVAILITHHHLDHIGGVQQLKALFPNCCIYGPQDSRITQLDNIVSEGSELLIESLRFEVLHTPGHTLTHICYYEPSHHWLFCGDTLFSAGCGRLFEGTPTQMLDSLKKISTLPPQTQIFCAHEYTANNLAFAKTLEPQNIDIKKRIQFVENNAISLPSVLAEEFKINPFLRTQQQSLLSSQALANVDSEDEVAVFTKVRSLKDKF